MFFFTQTNQKLYWFIAKAALVLKGSYHGGTVHSIEMGIALAEWLLSQCCPGNGARYLKCVLEIHFSHLEAGTIAGDSEMNW